MIIMNVKSMSIGQLLLCAILFSYPTFAASLTSPIAGIVATETSSAISNVTINCSGDVTLTTSTSENGIYLLVDIPEEANFTITPYKNDNFLNGVSTLDLVLITKHILGIQLLDSPYKLIAADINKSGSISTFDVVQMRKLILGITETLPSNTSWRFVPSDFVFADPTNPWSSAFPESIDYGGATGLSSTDFIGIKIGDVNGSAVSNPFLMSTETNIATKKIKIDNKQLKKGSTYSIPFEADANVEGEQYTLTYDADVVELVDVEYGNVQEEHINITTEGKIAVSWNGEASNDNMFTLVFEAKADSELSEVLSISTTQMSAESYDKMGGVMNISLDYVDTAVEMELGQIYPNPLVDFAEIPFYVATPMTVMFTVSTMKGEVVYEQEIAANAGQNIVPINKAILNTSGMLFYAITKGDKVQMKKMLVIE